MSISTLRYPLTFSSFLPLLVAWSLSDVPDRTRYSQRTFASLEYRTRNHQVQVPPYTGSILRRNKVHGLRVTLTIDNTSVLYYLCSNSELKLALSGLSDVWKLNGAQFTLSLCARLHVLWVRTPITSPTPRAKLNCSSLKWLDQSKQMSIKQFHSSI